MVLRILVLLSLYYTIVALAVEGGGNSTAESTRGNMTDVGDLLSEEEASNGTSTGNETSTNLFSKTFESTLKHG